MQWLIRKYQGQVVKLPSAVDDWMFGALSALETNFEFHAPKPPSQVGIFPVAKNAWVVCARSAPESLFAFDEHAAAHTHTSCTETENPPRENVCPLRTAPRAFIGSYGTFSWTMAILSRATTVHLPYCRADVRIDTQTCGLFIHDDDRVW